MTLKPENWSPEAVSEAGFSTQRRPKSSPHALRAPNSVCAGVSTMTSMKL
jgi:hypothetical protein